MPAWGDPAALALAYYRQPLDHAYLTRPDHALPAGVEALLRLAGERSEQAVESAREHGVDAGELADAARFFIKQVLFASDADHYRTLGVTRSASQESIRRHYRLLIRLFHPDTDDAGDAWEQVFATRINSAYNTLKSAARRVEYDRTHPEAVAVQRSATPGPAGGKRAARRASKPQVVGDSAAMRAYWAIGRHPTLFVAALGLLAGGLVLLLVSRSGGGDAQLIARIEVVDSPATLATPAMRAAPKPAEDAESQLATQALAASRASLATVGLSLPDPQAVPSVPAPTVASGIRREERRLVEPLQSSVPPVRQIPAAPPKPAATAAKTPSPVVRPVYDARPTVPAQPTDGAPSIKQAKTVAATPGQNRPPRPELVVARAGQAPAAPVAPKPKPKPNSKPSVSAPTAVAKPKRAAGDRAPSKADQGAQVGHILRQFVGAYQRGDLETISALFDVKAVSNGSRGRAAIRADYQRLFETSHGRQLVLRGVHWQRDKRGLGARGKLGLSLSGVNGPRQINGTMRVRFVQREGRLLISRMEHDVEG